MSKTFEKSRKVVPSPGEGTSLRLLTANELARCLNTTARNINRQASEGAIPCIRFGRSVRFDPLEVAEALKLKNPIIT